MIRSCDLSATLPLNMAAAASVFHRVRTGSKLGNQYDQDGNVIQVKQAFSCIWKRVHEYLA